MLTKKELSELQTKQAMLETAIRKMRDELRQSRHAEPPNLKADIGRRLVELERVKATLKTDTENVAKIEKWLNDTRTFVGVFENQELGHPDLGQRVGIPFDTAQYDVVRLGQRAPDMHSFIGWRYLLVAKCKTVEEALRWLRHEDKTTAQANQG